MRIVFLRKGSLLIIALLGMMLMQQTAFAQSIYQPYSYQFYQKFSSDLYSTETKIHTSIKPFFVDDSLLKHTYDSLMNVGVDPSRTSWLARKLFNEHLIDVKGNNGNTFYADVLPDLQIGRDFSGNSNVWTTSVGAQVGGTIGSKFSYYGSFYVNRAELPAYLDKSIDSTGYIPGQGMDRSAGNNIKDWYYSTFLLSYSPARFANFTIGKDKNFFGDGYRSMLLSDFASNYPFLKSTFTVGNVQYVMMYAYMNNPQDPELPYGSQAHKWAYFQYLDWNVSKRISLGIFENVMEATQSSTGQSQGFNPSLGAPFVFLVPIDNSDNNPAKNLLGATAKFKILNKTILYGQFALNELHSKDFFSGDGAVDNKSGYQLGIRGADLFNVSRLNFLAEFNTARPYTYSSFDQTSNYSQDGQSLADPFGANFREWLGILNYSAGRFDFQGEIDYAYFGLDMNGLDYGQNIFEPYTSAANNYGNYVGQGLRTNFFYAEGKIAYIINPKYNLRVELGALFRNETNSQLNSRTTMITVGLRSSFRDIYNDF